MEQGFVNEPHDDVLSDSVEESLLNGEDVELILSGHRIILRADDAGVITGYILEG